MEPLSLWQWHARTGAFHWRSVPRPDAAAKAGEEIAGGTLRLPSDADEAPVLRLDGGETATLAGLIAGRRGQSVPFRATVVRWSGLEHLQGAEIAGFREGDFASGTLIARREDATAALSRALIEGIEALPEAFVLYDAQDRLIICNEQYRRLYPFVAEMMQPGLHFAELVHASVARGVFHIEEDPVTWAERRISFHQAGIGFFEQHLSDGRWIQVSERRTASGGITSIRADITILKQRERDLRAARAQAEGEAAARTGFIAKVGHELRNPLNVVFGIAQLLSGEAMSKRHSAMVTTLFDAARAMRDVLNDILDVTQVQAGHLGIRPEVTPCRPLVQEIVSIARAMAGQKGLSVKARIGADLPEHILTDPRRLRQILLNLIGNAVKYTDAGTISLTTAVLNPPGGAVLRIAITDSGPGISEEIKARVFAPYARQKEHVAAGIEGLGLGLSISAELAQAIGARLGLGPGPERGTRAFVDLPIRMAEPVLQPPSGPDAPPRMPLDVLVIDDEHTNLIVADALLKRLGHRVTTARDGASGLLALRTRAHHAVLLDIAMPDMSGLEVARRIREEGLGEPSMALIAMTGNVMPEDIKAYVAAGFSGFVEKPVDLEELGEALAAVRHDLDGTGILDPTDRMRFPRAEALRAFDRTPLDRMVADIGHASVAAIVAAGTASFREAAAILESGTDDDIWRVLHKVRAVAGLLGLWELASAASQNERQPHALSPTQRAALRDALARAGAQMDLYAQDLAVRTPPD